jgi:hypothetical protein
MKKEICGYCDDEYKSLVTNKVIYSKVDDTFSMIDNHDGKMLLANIKYCPYCGKQLYTEKDKKYQKKMLGWTIVAAIIGSTIGIVGAPFIIYFINSIIS